MADKALHSNTAADTTLASDLSKGAGTASLNDGTGWPSPGSGEYAYAWIGVNTGNPELVKYTGRSGNGLTGLTRGVGGTDEQGWSAGARVYHGPTAEDADKPYTLEADIEKLRADLDQDTTHFARNINDLMMGHALLRHQHALADLAYDNGQFDIFRNTDKVGGLGPMSISAIDSKDSQEGVTTDPVGLTWSPDGFHYYSVHPSNETILHREKATEWDLSSTTNTSQTYSLSYVNPEDIAFHPNGKTCWILHADGVIRKHALTTAWDTGTASYANEQVDLSGDLASINPKAIQFAKDGAKFYIGIYNAPTIYEYDLSTAYDLTTRTLVQGVDVSTHLGNYLFDFAVEDNGGKLYLLDDSNNFHSSSFGTAYDLSTLTDDNENVGLDIGGAVDYDQRAFHIGYGGGRLFTVGWEWDDIYQFGATNTEVKTLDGGDADGKLVIPAPTWKNDYNFYDCSDSPSDWNGDTGSLYMSANNYVRLYASSAYNNANRIFPFETSNEVFTFSFRFTNESTTNDMVRVQWRQDSSSVISLEKEDDKTYLEFNGANTSLDPATNTTYKITVVIDWDNLTADLYIDDVFEMTDSNIGSYTKINALDLFNDTNSGGFSRYLYVYGASSYPASDYPGILYSKYKDLGFVPASVVVSQKLSATPGSYPAYSIEDADGNSVAVPQSGVDTEIATTSFTSPKVRLRAENVLMEPDLLEYATYFKQ